MSKYSKKINKEIKKDNVVSENKNGDAVISIKIEDREELFSKYSYNSDDVINSDCTDYIWHKSKLVGRMQDIQIHFHCAQKTDKNEVQSALKSYYRAEYLETSNELKKHTIFSFVCLLLGVGTLLAFSILNKIFANFYLSTVVDILAWVFLWEAFDVFFFQRASLARRMKRIQKLYSAKIKIIEK